METIDKTEPQKESALRQISELCAMPIKELKLRYQELFGGGDPPSQKDYLLRRIAYKIQENASDGLSEPARGRLEALKNEINPLRDLNAARRVPLPGTVISKTYKGSLIEVKVLHQGFEYGGKMYRSLSRIAREVSGVHQSGFVFFGL